MAIASWWRGDPLPPRPDSERVVVVASNDRPLLADLVQTSPEEVDQRIQSGHRAYVAFVDGTPAGHGWVATREAEIGELDLRLMLPERDTYLWDFGTVTAFRGLGVYPAILRAILERENADRFWIIYAPENLPSGLGIERAGFTRVADLSFDRAGRATLRGAVKAERVKAAARLLHLPIVDSPLMACWRCQGSNQACSCNCAWSEVPACCCAIQPGVGRRLPPEGSRATASYEEQAI
jgi:RimJ/RimL family protein N-acetyltransferase